MGGVGRSVWRWWTHLLALGCLWIAGCSAAPVEDRMARGEYGQAIELLRADRLGEATVELARQMGRDPRPPVEAFYASSLAYARERKREASDRFVREGLRASGVGPWAVVLHHIEHLNAVYARDSQQARAYLRKLLVVSEEGARGATWAKRASGGGPAGAPALLEMRRGREALLAGREVEAVGRFGSARELRPDCPYVMISLSLALDALGDRQTAQYFLERCLNLILSDSHWKSVLVAMHVALLQPAEGPSPSSPPGPGAAAEARPGEA